MKLTLFGSKSPPTDLLSSALLNGDTFCPAFIMNLKRCKSEVIIESPYTTRRPTELLPIIQKLKSKRVWVAINTRDPRIIREEYRRENTQEAVADYSTKVFKSYTLTVITANWLSLIGLSYTKAH